MLSAACSPLEPQENEAAAKVRQVYDKLAPIYDEGYADAKSCAENRFVQRLLLRERLVDGDVIDLGCGTGLLLELVDVPPARYLGLDISPGMLERAREKFPGHRFVEGDMSNLHLVRDRSFDSAVCLFGAWDYCLEPSRVAEEARRVLRPGGKLFVMACSHLHRRRQAYLVKKALGVELDRRLYDASTMDALLRDAGFVNLHVQGCFRLGDSLPSDAPGLLFGTVMRLEAAFGRIVPNSFYYLLATARTPGA
jgi:ubiquinone/menaquinone biosynthesis C-methylase UbiE